MRVGSNLKRGDLGKRSQTMPPPRTRRARAERLSQLRLPVLGERTPLMYADGELATFPATRGECKDGPRPCPWVRCRHHLAGEVKLNGALKLYHPDRELEQLEDTCSLDVADRGPMNLEGIGVRLNIVRERVRQIAEEARELVERAARRRGLEEGEDE